MNESRLQKSFLNARVNLIFYFITLALSFVSRKVFLDALGADFVGLTVTLTNLLGFLNIVELGVGLAIGYVLYQPLFDSNQDKISEIISVLGFLYRKIGLIILLCGLILSAFLPLIFKSTPCDLSLIYTAYYSFLISSLFGYFINYRQTLLSADQRNYVVTAYFQTANIIKIIIQICCSYYTQNPYLWVLIELSFSIIYSFILNWKINKVYPWLKSDIKMGKRVMGKYPEVMRYTKQLFIHKIGSLFQVQATPVLIYSFVSLETVAFYGNYTLITQKIQSLLDSFLGSTYAGVGNLIAEGKKENIQKVYWELTFIRMLLSGTVIYALYTLLPAFICLWLGEEYMLSNGVLYLILIYYFLLVNRGVTDQFINGYALFYDTWAPLAEAFIYIVVAVVGGTVWGLEGVLLGNIVSTLIIIYCWKPYFLFTKGFAVSVWKYWREWLKNIGLFVLSFVCTNNLINHVKVNPYESWTQWISMGFMCTIIFFVAYCVLLCIFTYGARSFINRVTESIRQNVK